MSKTVSKEKNESRQRPEKKKRKISSGTREWSISRESGGEAVTFRPGSESNHFFEVDDKVERELSYIEVQPLLGFLGYNQKEAATFLEVDPGTISRWKRSKNRIGQLRSKNLKDVDHIIAKGIRIFGSEENFREWLNTSNTALGDIAPVELLKSPYGVEQVEEAVDALSWGNYL
ncbi:antitoxin Xre/MbcA/ParS toxin-binding domain-containing protein [Zunongwangia sp. F363]|uniref:Antitoxin Xre/MbcA/ParS toxin-binding domain-containing protein n=1 Tax=Autumnicola tepida TaxID=3075595 RepID=A0ABU3CCY2_9FLAO|nr:antitoxin Xre/MbcA/ParS toxin-binding domain-containing protein [Zunongwangia sp. F363]MDT0644198.1 antitoxin Xre/MbcA/ParS toxin-binding domain-containing protein [Zunongwangia sp. F363]